MTAPQVKAAKISKTLAEVGIGLLEGCVDGTGSRGRREDTTLAMQ